MSYVRRLAVMLALALVLLAAGPAAGFEPATAPFDAVSPLALASDGARACAAYRRARWRWSTRRIPYYNAAKGNAWAVRTAVRAWNRSGVRDGEGSLGGCTRRSSGAPMPSTPKSGADRQDHSTAR